MAASRQSGSGEPLRIGLTGGIASGKSAVAKLFAELGATIIDTDIIAREVVAPGQPALDEIAVQFGNAVIDDNGQLDRAAMRQLIFSNDTARKQLEAIVHPRIRRETVKQASQAGGSYQLIVVPLLTESPLRSFVERILVVDCDENIQIERLLARDTDSEEQARLILAAQASRADRLAIADDVISNDGDLAETKRQVEALHKSYSEY